MFPIIGILKLLPWRLIGAAALALAVFAAGDRYGEQHVMARWDAEKAAQAQTVAKQAAQVAAVAIHQTTIDQEISNEFETEKARIVADRRHLLARVPRRVRHHATTHSGPVPEVSAVAAGTDAAPANPVPAAGQQADAATCNQLAEDAARTTLMVVGFQRWYREQAGAFGRIGQ
ncbi:hypothetical protein [Thiomonas sp.]|uniref:hypothetical protein n=1 Tax=Thiomonas sp. TaxID=2047785 RepID=UPI00258589B6|nr:hypothetical protein [Thiomonas sp.]